ncbi:MAG: Wzz/FepE/Etk N-terminal domain-containing protein [Spirosomaceae bacterium]|nr:Wzz/FepE/Etk N-terminal domain-containing protein [Spirosomataceae bacterium]
MEQTQQNIPPTTDEIEINIADIVKFLKDNLRRMMIWGVVAAVLGAIYAFTAQKEFDSKAVVLPELQSSSLTGKLGGLSALAGLAGVDLSQMNSTEAIRPDLYPNITQSVPFALHILQQKVYVSSQKKEMTLEAFFYSLNENWLTRLLDSEEEEKEKLDPKQMSQAVELDLKKENLIKEIQKRITTTFDRKTGIITINTQMPDPVVAATVARLSVDYLKVYVTKYRTEKAYKQMQFLGQQVREAKARYQGAEAALASYRDRNSFLVMNTAKVTEQRLQSEFMLAQNVYNGLVQQYEQAKIRVEEETPVFKLLEPAKIPLKKSAPKRLMLIFAMTVTGVGLSIILKIIQQYIAQLKSKI